jgi:hypothetical protein
MGFILADRVRDTSTTTGTGNFTVSGSAPSTYRTFSAVCTAADTFPYFIASQTLNEWEVGLGTYASTNVFARTTIYSSSNAGSIVTFSTGTKDVVLSDTAEKSGATDFTTTNLNVKGSSSGIVTIQGATAAGTYNFILPTAIGFPGQLIQAPPSSTSPLVWTETPILGHQTGTPTTGTLTLTGKTSGIVVIKPQDTGGTYNFNLPTSAGTAGQQLTSQGGSAAMTWSSPASGIPNVMDYGAKNTNNFADASTNVTAFNNAWAAAPRGLIYAPAGYYTLNARLLVPNIAGAGLIGDGGLSLSTVLNSNQTTGDVITNQSGIFCYKGFAIQRSLSSGTVVTRVSGGIFAATSGAGLNCGVSASSALIDDIYTTNSNVGLALISAVFATCNRVYSALNSGDGVTMIDTGGANAMQWAMDTMLSENNNGKGYNIDDGNHGVPVECHTNILAFNNGDIGYSAHGVANIRMNGGFFGNDVNHEVFVSGVANSAYSHIFTNVATELAGQPGVVFGGGPSVVQSSGFFTDSTLGCDVCLVNCSAVASTLSGVIHNATNKNIQIHGGFYNGNGTSAVSANNFGINILTGSASCLGVRASGNNSTGIVMTGGGVNLTAVGCNSTITGATYAAGNY